MAEDPSSVVALVAQERIIANREEIKRTIANVAVGNPLASEKSPARLVDRLIAKNFMTREEAEATAVGIRAFSSMSAAERTGIFSEGGEIAGAEAVWGQTIDFTGVSFFQRGRSAANAVARVSWNTGRARGSGFMVSDRLFLTNNHVIPTPEFAGQLRVEFDYELDIQENPIPASSFSFAPQTFFLTDDVRGLDFTLIAIGDRTSGARDLANFGYCPLSDASDKHAIGEVVNVVQHPNGRYKEVVLRENRLVARAPQALHYVADTLPGSSGSPVFNNQWQAVALHHWGGPFRDLIDDAGQRVPREVNEGIRISCIVQAIKARRSKMLSAQTALIDSALRQWETAQARTEAAPLEQPAAETTGPRTNSDGSISWTFPIEITVRAPMFSGGPQASPSKAPQEVVPPTPTAAEKLAPSDDYSDRNGYEPGFIPEHVVPLPKLSSAQRADAARNKEARSGDNPHEFQYHHFSVLINAKRKLAYVAACNINGRTSKFVDRDSGKVAALDPSNPKHGLSEGLEGAEASEEWFDDNRLRPADAVASTSTYETQNVPGFPTSTKMKRTLRMFQRGHLVRRLDPAWGTANEARLAEADTFHFTNCAPQVGFFNMGKGNPNQRGTGGGKLWRAVENLILRNARTMRTRLCAFTGPIFADDDREFRTIQVPGRFFKIAVWADDDGLRSLGMIADQRPVFGPWPEALFGSESVDPVSLPEAFQDPDEVERVDDFLTTIAEIEQLTDLDFGDAVRGADVRLGESDARPERLEDVPLTRTPARAKPRRPRK
jgi:endonuclease G, mitochondrial